MNLIFLAENNIDNIIFSENVLQDKAIINGFWKGEYSFPKDDYKNLKDCFFINHYSIDENIKSSVYVTVRKYPSQPDAIVIKGNIYECGILASLSLSEFKNIPCIGIVEDCIYPFDEESFFIVDNLNMSIFLKPNGMSDMYFNAMENFAKSDKFIKKIIEKIEIAKESHIIKDNKVMDKDCINFINKKIEKGISNFLKNIKQERIKGDEI